MCLPKVWTGGKKLIPAYLVLLSYCGDKEAERQIQKIITHNESLDDKKS